MYSRYDFQQLFYIDKEIKEYEAEIERIETRGEKCTQVLSDMPRASGISRKVEDASVDAAELYEIISYAKEKRQREKIRILQRISSVKDAEMRMILFFRYVLCLSWDDVARKMNSTYDAVRCKEKRFFRKAKSLKIPKVTQRDP